MCVCAAGAKRITAPSGAVDEGAALTQGRRADAATEGRMQGQMDVRRGRRAAAEADAARWRTGEAALGVEAHFCKAEMARTAIKRRNV